MKRTLMALFLALVMLAPTGLTTGSAYADKGGKGKGKGDPAPTPKPGPRDDGDGD